jgi:hypothetical protein
MKIAAVPMHLAGEDYHTFNCWSSFHIFIYCLNLVLLNTSSIWAAHYGQKFY